jgi:cysteine desulfurase
MTSIYLDNNATSPLDPSVLEAMCVAQRRFFANPSSQHKLGREARSQIDQLSESILESLGARTGGMSDDRLVFTSGGTESNNLALRGLLPRGGHLLVSNTDHPSVTVTAEQMAREDYSVTMLDVSQDGLLRLDGLREQLTQATEVSPEQDLLVSVMVGNNETGVVQPVALIGQLCREFGARFHTDAAQAVGKTRITFSEIGADALTLTPHKFHGPKGIGGLIVRHETPITPTMYGGAQQFETRPGTECTALVIGMAHALQNAHRELGDRRARLQSLRDLLESKVRAAIPHAVVVGEGAPRLPQTSCLAFPGLDHQSSVDRQALLMALDLRGLACSTGSACASGSSEPSPVLQAMGLSAGVVDSAIRLSVGNQNTTDEIETAADWIIDAVNALCPS